jgi:Phosphotransferase enzyme family
MAPIVDTIDQLTAEWFTHALGVSVTAATCEPFGVGQAASVIKARLRYDSDGAGPATAVVKLPSTVQTSRQMAAATGMYRAEVRYYEEVAPRVDLASPKVHFSAFEEDTNRFTLVIDDLSGRASTGDMLLGATPEQIDLVIGELVKLQAPLWNKDWLTQRDWLRDPTAMQMLFGAAQAGIDPFLERFGEVLDSNQRTIVRRLAAAGPGLLTQLWEPPFTVAHGDYRLDNMLFGSTEDAPPVCLVDWQMTRSAPPGIDVAVFLATCVDIDYRRAQERAILGGWVEQLRSAGVTGFDDDVALQRYRAGSLYPMILCVAAALTLGQNERDDKLWRQIARGAAALVADVEADQLITA